jgi:hypothetical protein
LKSQVETMKIYLSDMKARTYVLIKKAMKLVKIKINAGPIAADCFNFNIFT